MLQILAKFGDNHTVKTGIEEIRRFMATEITDNDRMNSFLNAVAEHHEHMKPQQRREQIKVYGLAAEIFEESLIPFLGKILGNLSKKLKEAATYLHEAIAETLGLMVYFILTKVGTLDSGSDG
jgi:ubiquinone biosynthesis protein UbiJ